MNFKSERFFRQLLKEAAISGKLTEESRSRIRSLFEHSLTEAVPDWLLTSLAALSGEREFLHECLAIQENALRNALSQPSSSPNDLFLKILGSLGCPQKPDEPEQLLGLTYFAEPRLRGIALLRLGEYTSPEICGRIIEELIDPDFYVRQCAIEALITSSLEKAAVELEKLLKAESNREVRLAALMALVKIGKNGIETIERLKNDLTPSEQKLVNQHTNLKSPTEIPSPSTDGKSD